VEELTRLGNEKAETFRSQGTHLQATEKELLAKVDKLKSKLKDKDFEIKVQQDKVLDEKATT